MISPIDAIAIIPLSTPLPRYDRIKLDLLDSNLYQLDCRLFSNYFNPTNTFDRVLFRMMVRRNFTGHQTLVEISSDSIVTRDSINLSVVLLGAVFDLGFDIYPRKCAS